MKLYNADCMPILRNTQDNAYDLVLTDIPYGEVNRPDNGYRHIERGIADIVTFDLEELASNIARITKGSCYIFCGMEQVSTIRKILVQNGYSTRLCIWEKTNPSVMNGQHIWLSGIECIVYGKRKGGVFNEHCKNTVFRYPMSGNEYHPTQKPLKLIKYLVAVSSNKGDTVFDPFMGSGTTGVAALEMNRDFVGIEKDGTYFGIAQKRIARVPNQLTLFE